MTISGPRAKQPHLTGNYLVAQKYLESSLSQAEARLALSRRIGSFSPIQAVQRHIPRAAPKLSRLRRALPIFQVHMRVSRLVSDTVAAPGKTESPTMTFQTDRQ
jgi:hypothetical protein